MHPFDGPQFPISRRSIRRSARAGSRTPRRRAAARSDLPTVATGSFAIWTRALPPAPASKLPLTGPRAVDVHEHHSSRLATALEARDHALQVGKRTPPVCNSSERMAAGEPAECADGFPRRCDLRPEPLDFANERLRCRQADGATIVCNDRLGQDFQVPARWLPEQSTGNNGKSLAAQRLPLNGAIKTGNPGG